MKILTARLVSECRVWSRMTLRSLSGVFGLFPRPVVEFGLKRHLGVGPTFSRNDLVWKFRLRSWIRKIEISVVAYLFCMHGTPNESGAPRRSFGVVGKNTSFQLCVADPKCSSLSARCPSRSQRVFFSVHRDREPQASRSRWVNSSSINFRLSHFVNILHELWKAVSLNFWSNWMIQKAKLKRILRGNSWLLQLLDLVLRSR